MTRHEIMTKRTREEIDRLAEEMADQWIGSSQGDYSRDDLVSRCRVMIFNCLDNALSDYGRKARKNG